MLLLGRDDRHQVRRVLHAHRARGHDLPVLVEGMVAVDLHVVHAADPVERNEGSAVQHNLLGRRVLRRLHIQYACERVILLVDGVVLKARRVVDRGGHVLRNPVLAGYGDLGDVVKLARRVFHGERVDFDRAAVRQCRRVANHDVHVFLLFQAEHQRRSDHQQQHPHMRDEGAVQAQRAADIDALAHGLKAELFAGRLRLRRIEILLRLGILHAGDQRGLRVFHLAKAQHRAKQQVQAQRRKQRRIVPCPVHVIKAAEENQVAQIAVVLRVERGRLSLRHHRADDGQRRNRAQQDHAKAHGAQEGKELVVFHRMVPLIAPSTT